MKKKICFLLCICLLICLFACDKGNTQEETEVLSEQETESLPEQETESAERLPDDRYTLELVDGKVISDRDYVVCLEKKKDKDFIILNLTDIQLTAGSVLIHDDDCSVLENLVDRLIRDTQPDLITLTGDQGYGEPFSVNYIGNFLDGYGIPWAPVLGNHDNDSVFLSPETQIAMYESFQYCLAKKGPENLSFTKTGAEASGNYIINVVEKDDTERGFHVVKSLLFFNSGNNLIYNPEDYVGETPVNDGSYAKLSEEQIKWYKWAVKSVQAYGENGQTMSAIFLHIPIYAYNTAYRYATENGTAIAGEIRESIGSSPYDDHVFDAVCDYDDNAETDFVSTDLIVAGHDHVNDFIIAYEKTTFVYGVKTGTGSYSDDDKLGGTEIRIDSAGKAAVSHHYYAIE